MRDPEFTVGEKVHYATAPTVHFLVNAITVDWCAAGLQYFYICRAVNSARHYLDPGSVSLQETRLHEHELAHGWPERKPMEDE